MESWPRKRPRELQLLSSRDDNCGLTGSSSSIRCYARRRTRRAALTAGAELALLRERMADEQLNADDIVDDADWIAPAVESCAAAAASDPIESPVSSTSSWPALGVGATAESGLSPVLYEPRHRPPRFVGLFLALCDRLVDVLAQAGEIDYHLVVMTFVYFLRLPDQARSWTPRTFYLLLYLAIQTEEECVESMEWFVVDRVLESLPQQRRQLRVFQQEKDRLWAAMQHRTHVSVDELEQVIGRFPRHRIFDLKRACTRYDMQRGTPLSTSRCRSFQ